MIVRNCQRFALVALSLGIALTSTFLPATAAKKEKQTKKTKVETVVTTGGDAASAVSSQLSALSSGLAAGDATKVAGMWTESGSYIDEDGALYKGRSALEKRFTQLFAEAGKQPVVFNQNPLQVLADNVALAEGVVSRDEGLGLKPQTRYSIVFVKQSGGNWLITNATETALVPEAVVNPLDSLNWIIGEWSAEREGKSVRMKAEWAANGKFINCVFSTKNSASAPTVESREVIGWDPRINSPVSWHFDATGGFGHGDWSKEKNDWIVKTVGVDREGNTTYSTDVLSLTAADAFSWQSVNRSVDGIAYNDSAPLKVVRVSK